MMESGAYVVRFKRPWRNFRVGQVIRPNALYGDVLLRMTEVCERIVEEPASIMSQVVNRIMPSRKAK